LRFFCDHDVDAEVAGRLRELGHNAWTAAEAGLNRARDDELTVYADDKQAALLTHDREFSRRRRRNVVGWHIQLRCDGWDAADLLEKHLPAILDMLGSSDDLFIVVSHAGIQASRAWE
jgi:predicted nuclease of predicted toxin-antitoxin system